LQEADAASLLILNADPEVMRYSDEPKFPSVTAMRSFIRTSPHTQADGPAFWAVERLEDGMFLGFCGLKAGNELGFRLFRAHWGRGYATESALLACYLGFVQFGLDKIIAETRCANLASLAVLNKLMMQPVSAADCADQLNCHFSLDKARFISHFSPLKLESGEVRFTNIVPGQYPGG